MSSTDAAQRRMPAEWEAHDRCWMAFPSPNATYEEEGGPELARARRAWSTVANTIVRYEPLTVVVDPGSAGVAAELLDPAIRQVAARLDDAWMRDIGPTFVQDRTGAGSALTAIDWTFNGWGGQSWASWDDDSQIARYVAAQAGTECESTSFVQEGGGFHVDGIGTVLLTDTVQRDPGRNPGWSREQVEAEVHARLGTTTAIWVPRGLTADYGEFGTRGHVDIVAAFTSPGTVLVHTQTAAGHPDVEVSREVTEILSAATDAAGNRLEVLPLPAPQTLEVEGELVDYSYVNHYVGNGVVVLCAFDDPQDVVAQEILQRAYPGREVVLVDARDIFRFGGGIHCITQQQPTASSPRN